MTTHQPPPAIEVDGLVKTYGALCAVDEVSFTVDQGEFFGILGPNGAGKTTTLELIEGCARQTPARSACWASHPGHATRGCCPGSGSSSRPARSSTSWARASSSRLSPPSTASRHPG
jgi:energy-coupling factor transporter ATP-binding protein EcfA2